MMPGQFGGLHCIGLYDRLIQRQRCPQATVATELVVAAAAADGIKPGGHRVLRVVAARMGPETDESLLHRIVGRCMVGKKAVCQPLQPPAVAGH